MRKNTLFFYGCKVNAFRIVSQYPIFSILVTSQHMSSCLKTCSSCLLVKKHGFMSVMQISYKE